MVKINNLYTSAGCNSTPGVLDWGENNLIIYGANNAIALLDPNYKNDSSKIKKIFSGHTKRVNCVKWIKNPEKNNNEIEFLSASDDGICILWKILDEQICEKIILNDHSSGITSVDGVYFNGILSIVTTSTDSSIKIWRKIENEFKVIQTISLKTGFSFAIRLLPITKSSKLLLIFSTDDGNINLYTETDKSNTELFKFSNKLIGHEDWVRSIDAIEVNDKEILIASSSQDTFIRLWKIKVRDSSKKLIEFGRQLEDHELLETEEILFKLDENLYSVTLESVLQSHNGWVYGVNLIKNEENEIQLLSSSIDKTLIIWAYNENESGVWEEKIRVGDVGGNSLGFYGGKFSPNGKEIVGHGYQGSLHLWKFIETTNSWNPSVISGGHFQKVNDLAWEPNGDFLFSVSSDQTTRCHAIWNTHSTWHEIARPQIHGYDIQCIATLSKFKFASGAEEKIIRSFQAPINFIENLVKISNVELNDEAKEIMATQQKGASVPSLGLSNRAVSADDDKEIPKDEMHFIPLNLEKPPFEENLMQNTLWPEVQKLYGHGNEIYSISSSHDGNLIASACRAANAEHAQIILWKTKTWKQVQKLPANKLTITQLKFSDDDKYLLSVSRDRRWILFENRTNSENPEYQFIQESPTSGTIHSRIIWTCDWSHDTKLFITGSREGKIISWKFTDSKVSLHSHILLKNVSIGALAFYKNYIETDKYLIAVGLETGEIQLYTLKDNFEKIHTIDENYTHHLNITKLEFRPKQNSIQLASCGEDHIVRINEINF